MFIYLHRNIDNIPHTPNPPAQKRRTDKPKRNKERCASNK